jgi:hypothetical protein
VGIDDQDAGLEHEPLAEGWSGCCGLRVPEPVPRRPPDHPRG